MSLNLRIPALSLAPYDIVAIIIGFLCLLHISSILWKRFWAYTTRLYSPVKHYFRYQYVALIHTPLQYLSLISLYTIIIRLGFVGVQSMNEVEVRSRWMALTTLICCMATGNNPYLHVFVSHEATVHFHVASAYLCSSTCTIHLAITLTTGGPPTDGIAIASYSIVLSCIIEGLLRSYMYEWFLRFHKIGLILLLIFLSLHVRYNERRKVVYHALLYVNCLSSPVIAILSRVYHRLVCHHTYKYHTTHSACSQKDFTKLDGALYLAVNIGNDGNRSLEQYFCLTIPSFSYVQSYPYFVICGTSSNVYFIIQLLKGFSAQILLPPKSNLPTTTNTSIHTLPIWLVVPHGKAYNLENYGSVLLLLTGIGITGVLPYLLALLESHSLRSGKTQRMCLACVV